MSEAAEVPEPVLEPDDMGETEGPPVSDPAARHRPRRRGRTTLMIAAAAALGAVAGTCTGYLVQADREPTVLPSLSQPVVEQAKGKGPAPLPAAQDRRLKTDGDLRELLLKKPRGATEEELLSDDGWMSLADYADTYDEPDEAFHRLVNFGFRRAATVMWAQGDRVVEIRLIQFRQEDDVAADAHTSSSQYWADEDGAGEWDIPGSATGGAYVPAEPHEEPGYLPMYTAEAHAWRGDISMEIWVSDTKPVPKATILDLAERQMERL
ncbi:hypothetical protein WJ438_21790 [Streptomyces sp. GD-15H]|uniref:hypothetical protein n=1 Tax=Streptomyces sp. GD-15H TaxID=3129112 RepID=UPI003246C495